jgi:hypothetical protein
MVQRGGATKPVPERRSGKDRRKMETQAIKGRERRRNIEPRKPFVTELDMSATEWGELQELANVPAAPKRPK